MTYTLRKAIGSEAKPLVGLYAESGCGKTYSSLLLAKGFCGDMSRVVMIETESGRGEVWADDPVVGGYNVLSMRQDFSPRNYGEAISVAENANAQALIVDSASHEWEGVGGVLSMAADNEQAGKKGPLVWQKPKMDHQREFMLRLTQTAIPLVIVCMRAKYVMEEIAKPGGGKEWKRSKDLSPKQSEDILSEMFVHGWIDRERHAFHGTKYTINAMSTIFRDGEPIDVDTGKRLAAWAASVKASAPPSIPSTLPILPGRDAGSDGADQYVTADQVIELGDLCKENGINLQSLLKRQEVASLNLLPAEKYKPAKEWLTAAIEYKAKGAA